MKLFGFETKKIWSKKIAIAGLVLVFGWFFLYYIITTLCYCCTDENGTLLKGKAAVQKNQEIAAMYSGPMTMEKAEDIIDKYGFSVYKTLPTNEYYRDGNVCNQWVTNNLTTYADIYTENPNDIQFYTDKDAKKFEAFLDPNLNFTYQDGWGDLISMLQMMTGMLNFVIIIAIANVFTEEYSLHTAPILLTSKYGKSKGILMKILSSIAFSLICTLTLIVVMLLSYVGFYGTAGIDGSAVFSNYINPGVVNLFGTTIGGILAETILLSFISVLVNTCITLAVSAACKLPFTSILISMGIYIFPMIYIKLIAPFFPESDFLNLTKAAVNRLPMYLLDAKLGSNAVAAILYLIAICAVTIFMGYRKYRSYQETS